MTKPIQAKTIHLQLEEHDMDILHALSKRLGCGKSAAIRFLIRQCAIHKSKYPQFEREEL